MIGDGRSGQVVWGLGKLRRVNTKDPPGTHNSLPFFSIFSGWEW